jgi:hypothetical protein
MRRRKRKIGKRIKKRIKSTSRNQVAGALFSHSRVEFFLIKPKPGGLRRIHGILLLLFLVLLFLLLILILLFILPARLAVYRRSRSGVRPSIED